MLSWFVGDGSGRDVVLTTVWVTKEGRSENIVRSTILGMTTTRSRMAWLPQAAIAVAAVVPSMRRSRCRRLTGVRQEDFPQGFSALQRSCGLFIDQRARIGGACLFRA